MRRAKHIAPATSPTTPGPTHNASTIRSVAVIVKITSYHDVPLRTSSLGQVVRVPRVTRQPVPATLSVLAAALGIAAIVTRPFLFAPIGMLALLLATKLTADRRITGTAAAILTLGALAGTAV